jgi:predicted DNA-binding protein YlxM (UPF0122 family)
MSDKGRQKPLTKRERDFAEMRYKDELIDEEIAAKVGIVRQTVYDWDKRPRIVAEIERLGRADAQRALRFFQKNAVRAAKATVKLTETRSVKDADGKVVSQDFVQPGEVVRKAAADILQGVNINVKAGEGGVVVNINEETVGDQLDEEIT